MRLAQALLAIVCTAAPAAYAKTLVVDTAKSVVKWKGQKKILNDFHEGTLKLKSGTVDVNDAGLVTGGEFIVDMTTIDDADLKDKKHKAELEEHLKSDDFFHVAKFPTAKFVVKSATAGEAGKQHVKGDLTLRDKTAPVEFDVTVKPAGGEYTAVSDTFTVDRSKHDVKYNSEKFFNPAKLGDKIIKDDLTVSLDLVAR